MAKKNKKTKVPRARSFGGRPSRRNLTGAIRVIPSMEHAAFWFMSVREVLA